MSFFFNSDSRAGVHPLTFGTLDAAGFGPHALSGFGGEGFAIWLMPDRGEGQKVVQADGGGCFLGHVYTMQHLPGSKALEAKDG